jgi:hypothetical protein
MSRSRRKRPFRGFSSSDTEKDDKRMANRKFRRKVKQRLTPDVQPETLPHLREVSNPWCMDKDGKRRFDPAEEPGFMRK